MWCLYILVFSSLCYIVCSTGDGTPTLQDIPDNANYAASDVNYDDGGLGPMFDFARSFINTALPGGFPKDFINETMSSMKKGGSGVQIDDLIPKILKLFKGYFAALVVGIIFLIVFPIVGCCFGCCRLRGNCGGKRKQKITPNMLWKQRIFAAILFVIAIFILVGNICTYVSNQRMTVAIDTTDDTVKDNLNDIDIFLNLVENQIETIGVINLNITKNQILDNMDQTTLENKITEYILNELSGGALKTMETNIETAKEAFDTVTNATEKVHTEFASVQPVCSNCQDPTNTQEFRDLKDHIEEFTNFTSHSVVDKVKDQLRNKIKAKLNNLNNQQAEVRTAFKKIEDKVHHVVDEVKKFKTNADSGIDIEYYKRKVSSIAKDVKKYDNYRYDVGAGLAAMTTIIVTLQFLGLVFGTVGQLTDTSPTERSCLSNTGGNMLIASVAFIFIFASLLMLLTTVSFAVGSLLERFVCQPLSPPSMELLEVADSYFPTKDTFQADLSSVVRDCRNGRAAYTAFHLSSNFNLSSVDSELQKQEEKIDDQMQQALDGIKNIGAVNFDTTASSSLTEFKDSLHKIKFQEINQQIDKAIQTLPVLPEIEIFLNSLSSLKEGLKELENVKNRVDGWSSALTTGLHNVTSNLVVMTEMDSILEKYKSGIINIAKEYVNTTKDNVENKMGRCTPLWNLYNSILLVSVCHYTVDAFNGFWFSIGWCIFFFVPAVIFAVKLAKYYHRMDYVEEESYGVHEQDGYALLKLGSNKVAPTDIPDGSQVT